MQHSNPLSINVSTVNYKRLPLQVVRSADLTSYEPPALIMYCSFLLFGFNDDAYYSGSLNAYLFEGYTRWDFTAVCW
jgi:hypothetical protein